VVKRMYQMSEKQFSRLVNETALKISKNWSMTHDTALYQLLERRCDTMLVRAGIANTIMQARQMITHGHRLLNGMKHNIPSYYVKLTDVLSIRKSLQNSPLYTNTASQIQHVPFWITSNPATMSVQLNQLPSHEWQELPADLLKVIEFYARV
jgi:small subunit ribosomal protein S4